VQSETEEYPEGSAIARRLGFRTILTVPLVGAGEAVGAIILRRARELCGAKFGHLILFDGEEWRAVALHNVPKPFPVPF
jgi:hypothetical protein